MTLRCYYNITSNITANPQKKEKERIIWYIYEYDGILIRVYYVYDTGLLILLRAHY